MEGGLEQSQKGWDLKVTMTAGRWSIALLSPEHWLSLSTEG